MSTYSFAHVLHLSTAIGTYEHADHTTPRIGHGYCTDDVARVLIAVVREPNPSPALRDLGRTALRFLTDAQSSVGRSRNRRSANGRWEDHPGVEDCWGRSLWAFGAAARVAPDDWMRQRALAAFDTGAEQRSPWPHAMAFAALGAADVLAIRPSDLRARALLEDAVDVIGSPRDDAGWPWPTARLAYANAAIAEALIAAGDALGRDEVTRGGLLLLGWLLDRETREGHLSPTPVGGAGPDDRGPGFDQQPIEVAAMADACVRALAVQPDPRWSEGIAMAVAWFAGDNDAGVSMCDPASGGGYDGLTAIGANHNEGAESTLAMISTLQLGARLVPVLR